MMILYMIKIRVYGDEGFGFSYRKMLLIFGGKPILFAYLLSFSWPCSTSPSTLLPCSDSCLGLSSFESRNRTQYRFLLSPHPNPNLNLCRFSYAH